MELKLPYIKTYRGVMGKGIVLKVNVWLPWFEEDILTLTLRSSAILHEQQPM